MAQPKGEGEDLNGHMIGRSIERIEDLALRTGCILIVAAALDAGAALPQLDSSSQRGWVSV